MVRGEDHDGVLLQSLLLQRGQKTSKLLIDPCYGGKIALHTLRRPRAVTGVCEIRTVEQLFRPTTGVREPILRRNAVEGHVRRVVRDQQTERLIRVPLTMGILEKLHGPVCLMLH